MPAPNTIPDILALLRAALERDFPDARPHEVIVRDRDGREEFRSPLPRARVQLQPQPQQLTPTAPPAAEEPAGRCEDTRPPARHSDDFRSVHWYGVDHDFTDKQAEAVRILWTAWEGGTPDVAQATLLEAAESESNRLRDVFRTSPAWGTMIVQGRRKGTFRLCPPGDS